MKRRGANEELIYTRIAPRAWVAMIPPRFVGGACVRPDISGYGGTKRDARRSLDEAIARWNAKVDPLADALALGVKIAHQHGLPEDLVVQMAKSLYSRTPGSEWFRVTGRPIPKPPKRGKTR